MGYKFLPAVFQTPGRVSIDFIAVHWMATTLAGCDATFTDGRRQASAHYGVENRTVHQYVKDGNTAWALGDWDANQRSISIEHSAGPGRLATDETYETSIELIASKCGEYGLEPSHDTIRPHNHFQATQCPGTMDLDRIIHGVQKLLNNQEQEDVMNAEQERKLNAIYDRVFGRDVQRYFNPDTLEVQGHPFPGSVPARSTDVHDVISTNNLIAANTDRVLFAIKSIPGVTPELIEGLRDELSAGLREATADLSITLKVSE